MHIWLLILVVTPLAAVPSKEEVAYQKKKLTELSEIIGHGTKKTEIAQDQPAIEPIIFEVNGTKIEPLKTIQEVNEKSEYSGALFEGDIMLTREQVDNLLEERGGRKKRQAGVPGRSINLWNRTIAYRFHTNFSESYKKYVNYAAELYSKLTCLKFVENPTASKLMEFGHFGGCWSSLGMTREGVQSVSLGNGCGAIRQAVHEIGHAVGLFHTQTRHDRDEHIKVIEENFVGDWLSQYHKESAFSNDNLGVPYDYGSVMHYGQFAPDTNLVGMEAKDKLSQWTMGSYLDSFYDIQMINKLYKCTDDCVGFSNSCKNGGYPNPNNCSVCICPRGYAGRLCNEMPQDAEVINLTPGNKTCKSGTDNQVRITGLESTEYVFKHFWIKAPENHKIKITYNYVNYPYADWCLAGCPWGGMEIKTQKDQATTGYRFCCREPTVVQSNSSFVPVIIYHRKDFPREYNFCAETASCLIPSPPCTNGGIQDPDNCSECICSKGFAGKLCEENLGSVYAVRYGFCLAGTLEQTRGDEADVDGFVRQYTTFKANEDSKTNISVIWGTLENVDLCVPGCTIGGIELKTDEDPTKSVKYCCDGEMTFISNQTLITMVVYIHKNFTIGYSQCATPYDEVATTTPNPTTTPSTTTPAITTRVIPLGSCTDSEGRVKSNGETWRDNTTRVEWKCYNGYQKVRKCYFDSPRWGEQSYLFLAVLGSVSPNLRCEEGGMIPVDSTLDKGSCTDRYGVVRKTGEEWEVAETLVTWICLKTGYVRVVSCRDPTDFVPWPVVLNTCPLKYSSGDDKRAFLCEPDGLKEVSPGYVEEGYPKWYCMKMVL